MLRVHLNIQDPEKLPAKDWAARWRELQWFFEYEKEKQDADGRSIEL